MRSFLRQGCLAAAFIAGLSQPRTGHAQAVAGSHITFAWGEEYELPKHFEDLGFVGNAADGYIQIGHHSRDALSFQKFDTKLHLAGEEQTDISNLPKDYTNEFFTPLGDKYYWFFSTYDKSEDNENLYAQEIDIKAGKVKGTAHRILSTTKLAGNAERTGMFSSRVTDKWNFYFSFDKKKILIQYRKKAERGDDNRNSTYGLNVFDESLTKLWNRQVRLPYTEKSRSGSSDFQVDNHGNVYTLVKVFGEDEGDRHHPDYHFELFKWSKEEASAAKIPFRFTDKFVDGAVVAEDPQSNIIVAGYYRNKKRSGAINGVFVLKLNPGTNELTNVMKGTYEFPASVLGQFESARTRRRLDRKEERGDDVEASNMVLRDVVISHDGSIQIFGEEFFIEERIVSNGRTTTVVYIYHYNDILAMDIGADGNLKWVKKIPKSQVAGGGGNEMGYKEYNFGDDTYFFFMDRESNMDLDAEHAPDTHNDKARGILVAVRLDKDGRMTKEMVYNGKEERVRITPTDFDDVGNNQIIVRGRARKNESQAALITFQ